MNKSLKYTIITIATVSVIALLIVLFSPKTETFDPTTMIRLTWTAPGDDGDIGTADRYDIRYALIPLTEENWPEAFEVGDEPMPLPAGSTQTYILKNLSAATTYYIGIKAIDEAGNTAELSNVATKTTNHKTQ